MSEKRIQKLGVAIGSKGMGKTFRTQRIIEQYILGNLEKQVPGRRALIFDVNEEFEGIKTLDIENVMAFSTHPKIEVRRILPRKKDGSKMGLNEIQETLFSILQNYYGGLLLIEDPKKYISDNLPSDLVGAICTNRHNDVDIIMHIQSIGMITPKIWGNLDFIRIHKTKEAFSTHRKKFEDKAECLMIAENIVNKQYEVNPRYYLFVDVEMVKIRGEFTHDIITEAILKYIYDNYKKLISPRIGIPDHINPEKKFTAAELIEKEKMRLLDYFK